MLARPPPCSPKFYEAHCQFVLRRCRRLLRDRGEAEDAAQETFLAAYRGLLAGAQPDEPAAWLATIARHTCWQRTKRRMREPLQVAEVDEPFSGSSDVFDAAARRSEQEVLWQAIKELPAQQQRAFVLCEVAGRSYADVASELGVSSWALESLLVRARRRLRTRLQPVLASVQSVFLFPFGLRSLLARLGIGASGASAATATTVGTASVMTKVAAGAGIAAILAGGSIVAGDSVRPAHHQPAPVLQTHAPATSPLATNRQTYSLTGGQGQWRGLNQSNGGNGANGQQQQTAGANQQGRGNAVSGNSSNQQSAAEGSTQQAQSSSADRGGDQSDQPASGDAAGSTPQSVGDGGAQQPQGSGADEGGSQSNQSGGQ
jgi:RNA polymerase sigma-70 factor (ECF subfamily)